MHISNGTEEFNSLFAVVHGHTLAVKEGKTVMSHRRGEVAHPLPRKLVAHPLLSHSVGLFIHLWKPAYEKTDISAERSIQESPITMQSSLPALSQHISGS